MKTITTVAAMIFAAFLSVTHAQEATQILATSGIEGGLIVHLGCGDGELTTALGAGDGIIDLGHGRLRPVWGLRRCCR